jgi:hypothetical protein
MLYGRTMPRANRGATISVACLLLLALLLLLPPSGFQYARSVRRVRR